MNVFTFTFYAVFDDVWRYGRRIVSRKRIAIDGLGSEVDIITFTIAKWDHNERKENKEDITFLMHNYIILHIYQYIDVIPDITTLLSKGKLRITLSSLYCFPSCIPAMQLVLVLVFLNLYDSS